MTHASICSGLCGPSLAASWLGWENLFHADINEFTNHILQYFYPDATHYTDIRSTDFRPWRGRVDVLSAGFPCQPFSVAGSRTGEDHDSYLWPETLRVVEQVRPRWFIGENVDGITSMVFPGPEVEVGDQADLFGAQDQVYERVDRYIVDRICCDLEQIGYEVVPVVIPACAVGAPHERMRIFFLCHDSQEALRDGWQGRQRQETSGEREQRDTGSGDHGRLRPDDRETLPDAPNARAEALREREDVILSDRSASRPHGVERRERGMHAQRPGSAERHFGECDSWADGRAWQNFPTQPPVCGRDDGFPDRISGITLSRWRRKSIEALGNAIVPQVFYEILLMIDRIEQIEA